MSRRCLRYTGRGQFRPSKNPTKESAAFRREQPSKVACGSLRRAVVPLACERIRDDESLWRSARQSLAFVDSRLYRHSVDDVLYAGAEVVAAHASEVAVVFDAVEVDEVVTSCG